MVAQERCSAAATGRGAKSQSERDARMEAAVTAEHVATVAAGRAEERAAVAEERAAVAEAKLANAQEEASRLLTKRAGAFEQAAWACEAMSSHRLV